MQKDDVPLGGGKLGEQRPGLPDLLPLLRFPVDAGERGEGVVRFLRRGGFPLQAWIFKDWGSVK